MSISQNFPTDLPTLNLDFVNNPYLDSRITFTRASSATYFNSAGVLTTVANNVPRFDHDPATLVPRGFLIEEQRTNGIRNNTMVNAANGTPGTLPTNWAFSGVGTLSTTVTTGTINGINYIDLRVNGTTSTGQMSVRFENSPIQIAAANGQSWTLSTFFALIGGSAANINYCAIGTNLFDSGGNYIGEGAGKGIDINSELTSNLKRISGSGVINTANTAFIRPYFTYTFNSGTTIDITMRIALPQLEQGFGATSPIPTSNAAAAVTRNADTATMTGTNFSSWYNPLEGTLYVESSSAMANATFPRFTTISDNTLNESIRISGSGDTLFGGGRVDDGGATQASLLLFPVLPNIKYKHALAYKANDFAYIANSTTSITHDTSGTVPTVDRIHIGSDNWGAHLNGHVLRVSYYPSRLSNTQLTALTRT